MSESNVLEFPDVDVRMKAMMERVTRDELIAGGASKEVLAFVMGRLREDLNAIEFRELIAPSGPAAAPEITSYLCEIVGAFTRQLVLAHLGAWKSQS